MVEKQKTFIAEKIRGTNGPVDDRMCNGVFQQAGPGAVAEETEERGGLGGLL